MIPQELINDLTDRKAVLEKGIEAFYDEFQNLLPALERELGSIKPCFKCHIIN